MGQQCKKPVVVEQPKILSSIFVDSFYAVTKTSWNESLKVKKIECVELFINNRQIFALLRKYGWVVGLSLTVKNQGTECEVRYSKHDRSFLRKEVLNNEKQIVEWLKYVFSETFHFLDTGDILR